MSLRITHDCINCGACEIECPQSAVSPGKSVSKQHGQLFKIDLFGDDDFVSSLHYYINPFKCNNCEGYFSTPRCIEVCPLPCCLTESEYAESETGGVKHKNVLTAEISLN